MKSPITPGIATTIRQIFGGVHLRHTYSRVPETEGAADLWWRQAKTPGTAQTGLPCRYVPRTAVAQTNGGYVLATEPPVTGSVMYVQTLTVAWDDDLVPGDDVQDIRDVDGTALLAGPATVQSVMPHAGLGPTTLKMLVLRGDTDERNG